jgi:hypothetical protein
VRRGVSGDCAPGEPDRGGDGIPWVEGGKHVPQEHTEQREAEPGRNEQQGQRDVPVRGTGALEAGIDREAEQEKTESPAEYPGRQ